MARAMFGSYACEPRVLRLRREAWLAELKRDVARTVHPGDDAAVLSGDPRDGALLFVPLTHGSSVSARGRRCLVPLTSLTVHAPDGDRSYRDPDRPLLTLAALADGVVRPEATHRFGFLAERIDDGSGSYDAPLIVEPAHHDEWLDGWSKTEDLRSCIQPLRLGRMVLDKP
jgi:hypothetical protein